ncbi:MAG: hypothetical protein ACP5NV_05315 [Candidatus Woesearchaeota archaeon]
MGIFDWITKGKKQARIATVVAALTFFSACSDMAKKADFVKKDYKIAKMLTDSSFKIDEILNLAKINLEHGNLKGIEESIRELDSLNDANKDFFYSDDITEESLKKEGYTEDETLLLIGLKSSVKSVREQLAKESSILEHH